jgi:hypothetical protein
MWIVTSCTSSNFWYILNTATNKRKKIGKVQGKGTNYYDKAEEECFVRNLRDYGKEVIMHKDGSLYDRAGNYAGKMEASQVPHNLS